MMCRSTSALSPVVSMQFPPNYLITMTAHIATEQQHTPILTGLMTLVIDRGWEVEVVPLVTGQRSVKEKEWLESFRVFGIDKEDGKKISRKLGLTLLNEHENLFCSYWRQTFDPSISLL